MLYYVILLYILFLLDIDGFIDALACIWIRNGYSRGCLDSFDALWQSVIASTHFSALDYAILY